MRSIFLFILGAMLNNNFPSSYKPSEEFALMYKIENQCIKALETKKMRCIGNGGGGLRNKHTHIFYFEYLEEKSIDESRALLINTIDKAVEIFKNCENFRKFLKEDESYTERNLEIFIQFKKPDGRLLAEDQFCGCCSYKGKITYVNNLFGKDRILLEETYEEAKAKLAAKP